MKDPYTVLGVSRTASQAEIKKAYRRLAKELHPDRNPGDKAVAERFKEISAANELLGDAQRRARYDRGEIDASGAERVHTGFHRAYAGDGARASFFEDLGAGFSPEDLFADLFGGFRGAERRDTARRRGADRKYRLKIAFIDAVQGTKRRLALPGGKTVDVTIPAGIDDGQTVRLKGQGESGTRGGPNGDVLVTVEVEDHPFFRREGTNVRVELPVTLAEAVLGATVRVPTIDGPVSLKVPPGSNTGAVLRLRGKGIVDRKSRRRGSQYMDLKVVLPDKPDPDLARRIAEWADDHDYDVRAHFENG